MRLIHRPSREDPGGWQEKPRTGEIKAYSSAVWRLFRRIVIGRTFTIMPCIVIGWVYIKYFGIAGVGGHVTPAERSAVIWTASACGLLVLLITGPFMVALYRSGYFRVTERETSTEH